MVEFSVFSPKQMRALITLLFLNFGTDGVIRLPQRFVPAQV